MQAQVDGQTVHIGKPGLFSELPDSAMPAAVAAANQQLVANGRTWSLHPKWRASSPPGLVALLF